MRRGGLEKLIVTGMAVGPNRGTPSTRYPAEIKTITGNTLLLEIIKCTEDRNIWQSITRQNCDS